MGAPWLADPETHVADPGGFPADVGGPSGDVYALTHNETSTGVAVAPRRPPQSDSLVLVDATSAAGAYTVEPSEFDVYYFSPQKALGSDGGLWIALVSPAALERAAEIGRLGRWTPPMLDLDVAVTHSRKDQTYNTPALATLFLLDDQIKRLDAMGGLAGAEAHCSSGASLVYDWSEARPFARPFVIDPALRSSTTATVELDAEIPTADLVSVLARHGIRDISGYRKLGGNQIRVGTFPNVPHEDIERLLGAVDYVVDRL